MMAGLEPVHAEHPNHLSTIQWQSGVLAFPERAANHAGQPGGYAFVGASADRAGAM